MNKTERDKLRIEFADLDGWTCGLNNKEMLALLDYVDALEAALIWYRDCCECEQVYGRQAREALDKGK